MNEQGRLHITNGDSAAARLHAGGIEGTIVPWRDVLHEGPVPDGLSLEELRAVRADFIAGQGWGALDEVLQQFVQRDATLADFRSYAEVVLWFEHDLYDQLQLIQVLDWFAQQDLGRTRLTIIPTNTYLGTLAPEQVQDLFPQRQLVTPRQLALGQTTWNAFRSSDPHDIEVLLGTDTAALPFLAGALRRHLEQYPSVTNGLSRSEFQALTDIAAGKRVLRDAYVASHHDVEEAVFLGDTVFAFYLERLSRGPHPLVLLEDGSPVRSPRTQDEYAGFWERTAVVTATGQRVLAGQDDWLAINGIDRWLGGVHLVGPTAQWRWDGAAQQLQPASGD